MIKGEIERECDTRSKEDNPIRVRVRARVRVRVRVSVSVSATHGVERANPSPNPPL